MITVIDQNKFRDAVLSQCDGTFPGSTPSLPGMSGSDLDAFIEKVYTEMASEEPKKTESQELLDIIRRRQDQCTRVMAAVNSLPYQSQIAIILSWMPADDVDKMIETLVRQL